MLVSIQRLIADYLHELARWRRQRAEEYDRDWRNIQSADGIEQLAEYVLTLPEDDERLVVLRDLAVQGERFEPGQQTHVAFSRFHFHHTETSFDAFLDHVVLLQIADANEMGHFGGNLPPDDDPWSPDWTRRFPS